LSVVKPPPIDTTPALIMVWASVFVLIISLFPNILNKIKKIKVKDFELELQETVEKATSKDFISVPDFDEHIFSTKGDFRNLARTLQQAARFPDKPVLLVANIREGEYISVPMLFVYLFFLDVLGSNVNVLFVSSRRKIQKITDIRQDCILGAVSGKKVIRIIQEKFPRFYRIYNFGRLNDNIRFEDFFLSGRYDEERFEHFFRHISDEIDALESNRNRYLTENDVKNWFMGVISSHAIELSISKSNSKEIRKALAKDDEFILILDNNRLNSVISICFMTRDITSKMLKGLTENK